MLPGQAGEQPRYPGRREGRGSGVYRVPGAISFPERFDAQCENGRSLRRLYGNRARAVDMFVDGAATPDLNMAAASAVHSGEGAPSDRLNVPSCARPCIQLYAGTVTKDSRLQQCDSEGDARGARANSFRTPPGCCSSSRPFWTKWRRRESGHFVTLQNGPARWDGLQSATRKLRSRCPRGVPPGHLQVPGWGKGAGVVTRSSTTPCSDPEPDQGTLGRLSFSQGPSGQVESLRRTTSSIRRTGRTCWGSRWQPRRAGRSVASVDLGMRCRKGGPEKKQLVRFFGLGLTVLASLSLVGLAVVFFLRPPLLPQSSVSGVPRGSQPSTPPVPRRVFRV